MKVELNCPKCWGKMRTVGQNILGELIQTEVCGSCGGRFFDAGEFEKVVSLELALSDRAKQRKGAGK